MPLLAEGEFALTTQHLEAARASNPQTSAAPGADHDLLALLTEAAVLQHDGLAIRKYVSLAEEGARRIEHQLHLGIAHRAWGVAHTLDGEFVEAATRLQAAWDMFAAYPAPWQMARTQFEMGELARARGQIAEARDRYAEALSGFELLRAVPYANRTRAVLEQLG